VSRIAGIVLAAGMSRRLGRPKQLLPLGDRTVIEHVVGTVVASSLDEVIVVLGAYADHVRTRLDGSPVRIVENQRFQEGQGTSLAAGVAALEDDVEAVVVLLADQPGVTTDAIDRVVLTWREQGASIAMAAYDDGRGHPVLFGREHFAALRELAGDAGGREIIRAHLDRVVTVPVEGSVLADIDTEDDWRAMEQRLRGESSSAGRQMEPRSKGDTMDKDAIREHMPVVGSDSNEVGTVDHLDDPEMIKLTKDDEGQHHWIPLGWVTRVDEHVHLDRPGKQARQEWSDSSPKALEEPQ
jgi:molybdenum cofactor cytidylyltransferase